MTAADSLYHQLRGHLAYLKLTAAAEALPAALDQATTEKLNHTKFLQRLLAIEVDATEARRHAGRLRFANSPHPGASTTTTSPPNPPSTQRSCATWRRAGSSKTPPTCC